ncbi:MATE family efflux transporter [Candidatus Protochlamydia phocaeensis]|uniref:MATE family efflux transporter n=1 Tax=Candidatus Protochlamydia phocaeensis TaxID=1414722 RepID=UPI00083839DD|nr:MATE family efflux transporter [Candidatus Protochlamydia phocaeensis]
MALTRFPEGSLRELIHIAFPLMLSSLSVMSMVFVDRLFLARYSLEAFNAVANAMTLGWAYVYGWMVLASIAEVFVAQYNGAECKKRLGEPVWQMIWLSLFSALFFIPLSLYGGDWFYGAGTAHQLEKEYFSWMMLFGPSFALYGALCGFFIGQGKTRLITGLAIGANLVNAGLDYLLIFGMGDFLPPMGVKGAAIATSGSSIFQALVLAAVFLNFSNRSTYGTNCYALQAKAFWQCVRIGFPGALFIVIELLGWASFYYMMTLVSERHITIAGISQSIVILLFFFAEGISKAAGALTGNLIGARKIHLIKQVILSGIRLHGLFFLALLGLFMLFSHRLASDFLPDASSVTLHSLEESLKICLFYICFYLLFEGIRLLFSGVLTAAGDTVFLMIAGSLSVWVFLVLPTYFLIVEKKGTIESASLICLFYSLTAGLLYGWRLKHISWKALSLIAPQRSS